MTFSCFINGIILSLPLIICVILNCILLFDIKEYKDGVFNDFYKNWEQNPIYSIEITENGEKLSLGKSQKNQDLFIWKGKSFYVKRYESDYFKSFKREIDNVYKMNLKLCGIDSNGNHLYFENCPINYIEFSSKSNPYISKEQFNVQTIKIDDSTYLHYSNKFINGKILIDLHISDHYGPCSYRNKKDICAFYNNCKDKCNSKENMIDMSYFNLDNDNFMNFVKYNNLDTNVGGFDNLELIYLYGRTYISSNNVNYNYDKTNDYIKIKNHKNTIKLFRLITFLMVFITLVCLVIVLCKGTYEITTIYKIPFIFGIISIFSQITSIVLEFKIREKEKNIQNYLKYIYHQVSEDYSKEKSFMKINYTLLFIYFINFLFLIYTICNYEKNDKSLHGWRNVIRNEDNDDSNEKIDDEDQFSWCSSEQCCFNPNPDEIKTMRDELDDIYSKCYGNKNKDYIKVKEFLDKLIIFKIYELYEKITKGENNINVDEVKKNVKILFNTNNN